MEDKFFLEFMKYERWQKAISTALDKDIDQAVVRQLCDKDFRYSLCKQIERGEYDICPPHIARIPKNELDENGNMKYREVMVNEPIDRPILSIINDMLFEFCRDMVHPRCMSYQTGIGCGKVVQDMSSRIVALTDQMRTKDNPNPVVGFKSDFKKYFDSVPIRYIDKCFDDIEQRVGKSCVIDLVRRYYHCDVLLDEDMNVYTEYKSLKQGCAVASFLADAILYHLDETMSTKYRGAFVRYCDDTLYIGPDYADAIEEMRAIMYRMDMQLNEKKTEWIDCEHWFRFLGFSIKGSQISLARHNLQTLCHEIHVRTITKFLTARQSKDKNGNRRKVTMKQISSAVMLYLYHGKDGHSWATCVLTIINVPEDIYTLNCWIIDNIRAALTGKCHIGGLGYVKTQKAGCISRGIGSNVTSNKRKVPHIDGYISLNCARKALLTSTAAYRALIRTAA